jgi:hypothetical protein
MLEDLKQLGRIKRRVQSHPVAALIVFGGVVVIGLGQVAGAFKSLHELLQRPRATAGTARVRRKPGSQDMAGTARVRRKPGSQDMAGTARVRRKPGSQDIPRTEGSPKPTLKLCNKLLTFFLRLAEWNGILALTAFSISTYVELV